MRLIKLAANNLDPNPKSDLNESLLKTNEGLHLERNHNNRFDVTSNDKFIATNEYTPHPANAPYIEKTAISFELVVPSVDEFRDRIIHTLKIFPYIVAEIDGEIVGYAYVSPFKERSAYDHCVETSIYVKEDARGKGIGSALYEELERLMPAIGVKNMNACIAWIEVPDEYLDNASETFHEKHGYTKVAHFHKCGFKFGRYYDMIWMEKILS